MSAVSLATLGVICDDRARSMATLGVFCATVVAEEQVRGGASRKRKARQKAQRIMMAQVRKQPELSDLLPKDISETTREAILKGKVEVGGVEVIVGDVPTPPVSPISLSAIDTRDIIDPLDREIAELIRTAAALEHAQLLLKFQEEVRRFEEEFLMFLILMTE